VTTPSIESLLGPGQYLLTIGGQGEATTIDPVRTREDHIRVWNIRLRAMLDESFDDGFPVLRYVFAVDPALAERLRAALTETQD